MDLNQLVCCRVQPSGLGEGRNVRCRALVVTAAAVEKEKKGKGKGGKGKAKESGGNGKVPSAAHSLATSNLDRHSEANEERLATSGSVSTSGKAGTSTVSSGIKLDKVQSPYLPMLLPCRKPKCLSLCQSDFV